MLPAGSREKIIVSLLAGIIWLSAVNIGSKVKAFWPGQTNRLYRQDINVCLGEPACIVVELAVGESVINGANPFK